MASSPAALAGDADAVSQSPIDITTRALQLNNNNELITKFSLVAAGGVSTLNDGRSIVVKGLAGSVTFEKMTYTLTQLHIRRGEHRIDGRVFPVELQVRVCVRVVVLRG